MIYVKSLDGKGTFATLWEVNAEERSGYTFVKGKISTSRKDQNDNYINSTWFVTFGKNCADKAKGLPKQTRIILKDFSIENIYNKDTGKGFTSVSVYAFDLADGSSFSPVATGGYPKSTPPIDKIKTKTVAQETEDDDNSLPFDL
jgi:hypothetical protein